MQPDSPLFLPPHTPLKLHDEPNTDRTKETDPRSHKSVLSLFFPYNTSIAYFCFDISHSLHCVASNPPTPASFAHTLFCSSTKPEQQSKLQPIFPSRSSPFSPSTHPLHPHPLPPPNMLIFFYVPACTPRFLSLSLPLSLSLSPSQKMRCILQEKEKNNNKGKQKKSNKTTCGVEWR